MPPLLGGFIYYGGWNRIFGVVSRLERGVEMWATETEHQMDGVRRSGKICTSMLSLKHIQSLSGQCQKRYAEVCNDSPVLMVVTRGPKYGCRANQAPQFYKMYNCREFKGLYNHKVCCRIDWGIVPRHSEPGLKILALATDRKRGRSAVGRRKIQSLMVIYRYGCNIISGANK